ncbi:MAG: S41 family peptidase [Myxococcota bacterium]
MLPYLFTLSVAAADLPGLSVEEQATDVAVLRQALDAWHPGLTLYASPEAIDTAFAEAVAQLRPGATALELWSELSRVVALLGCTHTVVSLRSDHWEALGETLFPLDLVVVDDVLYVDPRSHPGPIRAIDTLEGMPGTELLEALRDRMSSDGGARSHRDSQIDRVGRIGVTGVLGSRASWTVQTRDAEGTVHTEVLPGTATRRTLHDPPHRRRVDRADGVAVRTIGVADFADSEWGSRRRMASIRRKAARVDALVIDLRGNGGGRTQSLLDLFALFASEPFDPYTIGWTRQGERFRWTLAPPGFLPSGAPTVAYAMPVASFYPTVQPDRRALSLPLVLIVDGSTGSSASDLAAFLQATGRARVVGAESASGRWIQNCEAYDSITLPKSRLHVRIPLIALATADEAGRGHGVVPEVPVQPSIEDLAVGRDVVLERAVAEARARVTGDGAP